MMTKRGCFTEAATGVCPAQGLALQTVTCATLLKEHGVHRIITVGLDSPKNYDKGIWGRSRHCGTVG